MGPEYPQLEGQSRDEKARKIVKSVNKVTITNLLAYINCSLAFHDTVKSNKLRFCHDRRISFGSLCLFSKNTSVSDFTDVLCVYKYVCFAQIIESILLKSERRKIKLS